MMSLVIKLGDVTRHQASDNIAGLYTVHPPHCSTVQVYTTVSAAFINNESTLGLFRLIIKYIKIHDFSDIKEIELEFFFVTAR